MKNNKLKGRLLTATATCYYCMLGTFVKMAYLHGFSIAEITLSQFSLGFLGLLILSYKSGNKINIQVREKGKRRSSFRMIATGTSLGLTSICHYGIKYIAVSIGIVRLLQGSMDEYFA